MLSERDLGRVACVGQRQHLAVDEQGVAADLDGAIAAAVDGVVLDLAGQVLSVVGRVDELRLDLRIPHGTAGHRGPLPVDRGSPPAAAAEEVCAKEAHAQRASGDNRGEQAHFCDDAIGRRSLMSHGLHRGARPFVGHEAQATHSMEESYVV